MAGRHVWERLRLGTRAVMRLHPPVLLTLLAVGAVAVTGCGDDAADPVTTNVPGVSSNTGDGTDDQGVTGTSLPASTDPQTTAAPNPAAGGGSGDTGTGSAP